MYLASNKINKINLGSTEVKKVYQGSDLLWRGLEPYIFDYSQNTFSQPDYIEHRMYGGTNSDSFTTSSWDAGFYKGPSDIYTRVSYSSNLHKVGKILLKQSGKFRVTVDFTLQGESIYCFLEVQKKDVKSAIDISLSTRVFKEADNAGDFIRTFEVEVLTEQCISFVAGTSSTGIGIGVRIRSITIEPI